MTLDEAIKQLGFLENRFREQKIIDKAEAIKLGIEALKRCRVLKQESVLRPTLLRGETEE